jgi:eukaryotic-like serine/threonine-protein kinase
MPKYCARCRRELPDHMRFCPFDGSEVEEATASTRTIGFAPKDTRFSGAILRGRYRILGFVSKGATARVYLAEDLEDDRVVAVKLFSPAVREREAMRDRFLKEADALHSINHPNVVRVFDAGEVDSAPFLVMEALRGETLGQKLERVGSLDQRTAVRYAKQAAAGLSAAHRAGIVHRDVKPDNLFLVDGDQIKLLDFGMAKVERDGTQSAELVMGTVQYMAPEQIVTERVDARTDVYGLGVVLFRMLTGHLPFDVEMGTTLLGHQLFSPAPPPSWLDDDLDKSVERVILSAMRKDPANRYPSMDAFLEDLSRDEPRGAPMVAEPDVYHPSSQAGHEAAKFLSQQFRASR